MRQSHLDTIARLETKQGSIEVADTQDVSEAERATAHSCSTQCSTEQLPGGQLEAVEKSCRDGELSRENESLRALVRHLDARLHESQRTIRFIEQLKHNV